MTHFGFSSGNSVIESNKIGRYCGDTIPNPIFPENTNQMLLKFRSDQLVSGKGFDLSYTSNQQQCGGNLTGTHGNVYMSYWPEVIDDSFDDLAHNSYKLRSDVRSGSQLCLGD